MKRKRWGKWLAGMLTVVLLAAVIGQGSREGFLEFGRKAALISVGLQKPDGSAIVLSERMDEAAAKAAPQTTASVTAGTTVSTTAPTTAATTVPSAAVNATLPSVPHTSPSKAAGAGTVLEQLISPGSEFVQGVAVRNRSGKAFDLAKELQQKLAVSFQKNIEQPQVLIVHTHTTEGYLTYDTGFYNPTDVERTKDESRNICAAGEAIAQALRQEGIAVVHDTTIHDFPQYTGAYARSEKTVKAALAKYPTVQVVLDIHRDAILPSNTSRNKPTAMVDGKKAAQMMIIAGVVSTNELPHPNWQQNFHFALQLQKALANRYPNLMRPLYLVASRYNQHLAPGYLLVEVGTDVNTVEEAVYSGSLLGKTLAETLMT